MAPAGNVGLRRSRWRRRSTAAWLAALTLLLAAAALLRGHLLSHSLTRAIAAADLRRSLPSHVIWNLADVGNAAATRLSSQVAQSKGTTFPGQGKTILYTGSEGRGMEQRVHAPVERGVAALVSAIPQESEGDGAQDGSNLQGVNGQGQRGGSQSAAVENGDGSSKGLGEFHEAGALGRGLALEGRFQLQGPDNALSSDTRAGQTGQSDPAAGAAATTTIAAAKTVTTAANMALAPAAAGNGSVFEQQRQLQSRHVSSAHVRIGHVWGPADEQEFGVKVLTLDPCRRRTGLPLSMGEWRHDRVFVVATHEPGGPVRQSMADLDEVLNGMGMGYTQVVRPRNMSNEFLAMYDPLRPASPLHRKMPIKDHELAYALAHAEVWARVVALRLPYALVFEDDAMWFGGGVSIDSRQLRLYVERVLHQLNLLIIEHNNRFFFDVLFLARRPLTPYVEPQLTTNIVRAHASQGTHAYVVSFEGAKKFLREGKVDRPVAEVIANIPDTTLLAASPPIFTSPMFACTKQPCRDPPLDVFVRTDALQTREAQPHGSAEQGSERLAASESEVRAAVAAGAAAVAAAGAPAEVAGTGVMTPRATQAAAAPELITLGFRSLPNAESFGVGNLPGIENLRRGAGVLLACRGTVFVQMPKHPQVRTCQLQTDWRAQATGPDAVPSVPQEWPRVREDRGGGRGGGGDRGNSCGTIAQCVVRYRIMFLAPAGRSSSHHSEIEREQGKRVGPGGGRATVTLMPPKLSMWQTFVIGLASDETRFLSLVLRLRRSGFGSVTRALGVAMDSSDFSVFSHMVDPNRTSRTRTHPGWWSKDGKTKARLSVGEVGCALSHYLVWVEIVNRNLPYAIIFEDDVVFSKKFQEEFQQGVVEANSLIALRGMEFDVLLVGAMQSLTSYYSPQLTPHVAQSSLAWCSYAYVVSLAGAKKLVSHFFIDDPLDSMWWRFTDVRFWAFTPSLANHLSGVSNRRGARARFPSRVQGSAHEWQ